MTTKLVCIQCTAISNKGLVIMSREFNLNHSIDDAADYALLTFLKEVNKINDYAEQTVRVTVDIALPERWWE